MLKRTNVRGIIFLQIVVRRRPKMINVTKASQMDSQELLEYYYMVKAKYERCIGRKWNPYKTAAYEARIELIRRGLK
jgi:hypothetical protein